MGKCLGSESWHEIGELVADELIDAVGHPHREDRHAAAREAVPAAQQSNELLRPAKRERWYENGPARIDSLGNGRLELLQFLLALGRAEAGTQAVGALHHDVIGGLSLKRKAFLASEFQKIDVTGVCDGHPLETHLDVERPDHMPGVVEGKSKAGDFGHLNRVAEVDESKALPVDALHKAGSDSRDFASLPVADLRHRGGVHAALDKEVRRWPACSTQEHRGRMPGAQGASRRDPDVRASE